MSPSISIRESIRWLPHPASEPTRTVVLTSPENRFIDIRILRLPGYATDSQEAREEDLLPLSRLDWAFAGTSSSTVPSDTRDGHIAHAKWSHWVDSRFFDAENVSDEGDMFTMADGRTLERGEMVNPETGVVGEYEEVWRDVEVIPTRKIEVSPLGGEGQGGKGKGKGKEKVGPDELASGGNHAPNAGSDGQLPPKPTYTVLTLHDDAHATRGMIIQLGQFCQGILRSGEHIALERWIWGESKGWQREFRMGDMFVPCGLCTGGAEKVPEIGGTVVFGEWRWVVVEKGEV